ncbi:MAG: MXAN_5187 C-terminal domain-containing protein [Thermoanaerobaculia bacterium]
METQASIERLARDIQQLKVDFERFFNGGLPVPPEEFRQAVQQRIRTLRSAPMHALVDRFRLNTLEARFNALNELFNRRLREREEGALAAPARLARPTPQRYDPYKGIVVGEAPPPEAIQALYRELYDDDTPSAGSNFRKFHSYLLGQMAAIRERSGCDEVSFRVANENGKVKLKAKPIRHLRL